MFLKLKKLVLLGPMEQARLLSAWCLLGRVRWQLKVHGLRYFTTQLCPHQGLPAAAVVTPGQFADAVELSGRVRIAARYTPWQSTCLVQVLALQCLLEKRGVSGDFSLGVRTDVRTEDSQQIERFHAHAWLRCGQETINGAATAPDYKTLTTFSWCTSPSHVDPSNVDPSNISRGNISPSTIAAQALPRDILRSSDL